MSEDYAQYACWRSGQQSIREVLEDMLEGLPAEFLSRPAKDVTVMMAKRYWPDTDVATVWKITDKEARYRNQGNEERIREEGSEVPRTE